MNSPHTRPVSVKPMIIVVKCTQLYLHEFRNFTLILELNTKFDNVVATIPQNFASLLKNYCKINDIYSKITMNFGATACCSTAKFCKFMINFCLGFKLYCTNTDFLVRASLVHSKSAGLIVQPPFKIIWILKDLWVHEF